MSIEITFLRRSGQEDTEKALKPLHHQDNTKKGCRCLRSTWENLGFLAVSYSIYTSNEALYKIYSPKPFSVSTLRLKEGFV